MQTFLPYPDFVESARCLDYRRLGKQRVEVLQLLKALKEGGAWSNHPACKMWKGHENSLVLYGLQICIEWVARGYRDTCYNKIADYWIKDVHHNVPSWVNNGAFHAAHRSNLLRKDPIHYGKFGWIESPDLPYIWPENKT